MIADITVNVWMALLYGVGCYYGGWIASQVWQKWGK